MTTSSARASPGSRVVNAAVGRRDGSTVASRVNAFVRAMTTEGGATRTRTRTRANDPTHRERSTEAGSDGDDASMTWSRRASSWTTTTTTVMGDGARAAVANGVTTRRHHGASTPPTVALTVGLTRTYQGINARYYEVGGRAVFGRRVRSTATRGMGGLDVDVSPVGCGLTERD